MENDEEFSPVENDEEFSQVENDEDFSQMENDEEFSQGDNNSTSNAGWADVMQRILKSKKPRRKKTVVLAKAKKLSCLKPKTIKSENGTENNEADIKLRKTDWISKGRLKPNPLERNREKHLQKITVRGVVCLYNAVNQHQKSLATTTSITSKQEKQLKSINKDMFIDILLKGSTSSKVTNSTVKADKDESDVKNEDDDESNTWSVLKDDFMSGRKWKNWDKSNAENEIS